MGNASNAVWNSCYGQWSYLVSCTRQVVSFTLISILLLTLLLGAGWSTNNAFGVIGGPNRPNSSRPVTIRLMISQACKQLTANSPAKTSNGFHSVTTVLRQVEQLKPINEAPVQIQEMLDICDTEGNAQNGGGSFTIRDEGPRGIFVRFDTDDNTQLSGRGPGEIGSPIQGNSTPAFRPFHPPGGIVAPSGF